MEEQEQEYSIGSLAIFKDLTQEQKDLFLKLLSDDYSYVFQVLYNVIDDDLLVMELIDIFAGQKIQFPTRKKLHKLLEKIQIYTYVKKRDCSPKACKLLAKQYGKRVSQIKSIVTRIDYLLDNGKYSEIEKFEQSQEEK